MLKHFTEKNLRRLPTEAEKRILVRYVGWGGLPQVFDLRTEQWSEERIQPPLQEERDLRIRQNILLQ